MMLTSAGQRGDAARCRQLGVAAYLTKPVGQSELFDALVQVLGRGALEAQSSEPLVTRHSLREGRKRLRILLAEDNVVNQKLAVRLLEKRESTVLVASNGREAVAALEKESFDLVLMDLQMPGMDGFEATSAIREKETTSGTHIPIIAMTAHAMKGDRERCLAAGFDGYVSKPVRPQELFEAITALVSIPE
jgi:two-component system, sensor histidine kinase and response regulator